MFLTFLKMEKRVILIFCIFASLVYCDATNVTEKADSKQTKSAEKSELSTIHLASEANLQQSSNKSVSHVKGRKSADPNEYLHPAENKTVPIPSPAKEKVVSEGISLPDPAKPGNPHLGREGVADHTTSEAEINKTASNSNPPAAKEAVENIKIPNAQLLKIIADNNTAPVTSHATIPAQKINSTAVKVTSSSTSTTSTTTTTTTTTTSTTTTTTPKPKKPKITYSIEDLPSRSKAVPPASKLPTDKLNVEEPEQPIAQPSQEFDPSSNYHGRTDYIVPIVTLIFAVPIVMGALIIMYRRVTDYWSTRHYRRMDFLVDGMYND